MSETAPTVEFNPLDPALAIDPYPAYRALRETDPVHQSMLGVYLLTRHADVVQLLGDNETFQHQYLAQQQVRVGPHVEDEPYFAMFRRMVFVLDNPDHRRIRKLLHRAFTPRRVADLRDRASQIAHDLLDRADRGGIDFVRDFAFPFPMRVIGTLLGIPDADHERIGAHATALNPVLEFLPMSSEVLQQANEAVGALREYFTDLAARRRSDPTDDLFSAMVHATEDGTMLSDDELIANAILLYIAGHETTAGGASLAVLSLHRNPDQLALLQADRSLIPQAVAELLRYDTPGQGTARVLMADATFGDVTIPAGNMALGYIGAANRDPAAFPDPDRLDLTRTDLKTTTWGGGAHLCMGRNLALQEFEITLEVLLERCPGLQLETLDPPFRANPLMRGLEHLPMHW
jgi:hypothetical protein